MAVILLSAVGALAAACGDSDLSISGVIINVETLSLTEVDSFTVRGNNGQTIVFEVNAKAALDAEQGLAPSHLREHALAVEEVTVSYYVTNDDRFIAIRVEHR